jgi:hypothetical protein
MATALFIVVCLCLAWSAVTGQLSTTHGPQNPQEIVVQQLLAEAAEIQDMLQQQRQQIAQLQGEDEEEDGGGGDDGGGRGWGV